MPSGSLPGCISDPIDLAFAKVERKKNNVGESDPQYDKDSVLSRIHIFWLLKKLPDTSTNDMNVQKKRRGASN